jgi:hypothetical protein
MAGKHGMGDASTERDLRVPRALQWMVRNVRCGVVAIFSLRPVGIRGCSTQFPVPGHGPSAVAESWRRIQFSDPSCDHRWALLALRRGINRIWEGIRGPWLFGLVAELGLDKACKAELDIIWY